MAEDFNAYMPGRSLSTISMISRVSGRVLGGPKTPTWKAWKNEAPGHQNRARRAGFESELRTTWKTWKAWKNEAPGHQNRARRAGFESEIRTTWKTWKAWKNEAPGHQNRARDQGVQKHNMERVEKDFSLSLGRVFQLSTLY